MSYARTNPVDIDQIIMLGVIGLIVYGLYKAEQGGGLFGQDLADNGMPKCSTSDFESGNCVSGDGYSQCSSSEFLTQTSCYRGTPKISGAPAYGSTPSAPRVQCSYADFSAGNCVSGDGVSPCGWWEVLTATTCFKGTPTQA